MAAQPCLGAALAAASAILFAFVGRAVAQRRVSPEARRASDLCATWWFGLAAITALGAANSLLAATATLMAYRPPSWVRKGRAAQPSREEAAVVRPQLRMQPAAALA